jgi:hypothetical protein
VHQGNLPLVIDEIGGLGGYAIIVQSRNQSDDIAFFSTFRKESSTRCKKDNTGIRCWRFRSSWLLVVGDNGQLDIAVNNPDLIR